VSPASGERLIDFAPCDLDVAPHDSVVHALVARDRAIGGRYADARAAAPVVILALVDRLALIRDHAIDPVAAQRPKQVETCAATRGPAKQPRMQNGGRLARPLISVLGAAPGEIVLLVAAAVLDVAMQRAAVRPRRDLLCLPGILDELETPVAMRAESVSGFRQRLV
jgi:hypothetical protein